MASVHSTLDGKSSFDTRDQIITPRFEWLVVIFLGWFLGGAYLDSWAHNHIAELESFFTPWHGVLYSGFALAAGVHVLTLYRRVAQGIRWQDALPKGYQLSLIGIVIFAVGGVGDMLWHEIFGVEKGVEGMISPTHLLLIVGATFVYGGPLRAAWQRRERGNLWPAMLSLFYLFSLFTLVGQFANLFINPDLAVSRSYTIGGEMPDLWGMASVVVPAAIAMGFILLAVRRWWSLPAGTLTFLLGVNGIIMFLMSHHSLTDYPVVVIAPVAAGLAGDMLLKQLKPALEKAWAFRIFAFSVPFIYYLVFFLALMLTGGIRWSIHVWLGLSFLAGIVGLLLSYAFLLPPIPSTN
jgi:hypothetical protein